MDKKSTKVKIVMTANPREIVGKSTRSLRKSGVVPANIYGKDFESLTISVDLKEFVDTFKTAGETNVVYVKVSDKEIPTLISEIQIHPVNQSILHVDLRKIDLKQKIEAQVPLVIFGESEAVEVKHGILLTQMTEITIESLPSDIPNEISVDISTLNEIGDVIRVSDLPKIDGVEFKEDPERMIASVTEHKEEELVPETVSDEPEIIGEDGKAVVPEGEEGSETPTKESDSEEKN